ncbi:type VII secretion target [Mycobacterium sp. NPDC003323]
MSDPLHVQTDGVLNYSQIHADVRSGLSGLAAPEGSGVQNSHGAIASSVSTALGSVLSGRGNTMGVTSTSAATIADLLQQAARAYAGGDEEGGRRLKAAADAMDGDGRAGAPGGAPAASGTTGAGGDMAGQMGQIMGQVGQQVGQLASSITAPLQGLAQGLQQVPQQIMQGVQQAAQQAAQAAQAGKIPGVELSDGARDVRAELDDSDDKRETAEQPAPEEKTEAEAGQDGSGRAPVEAPATRPAPTRPQVD